jgi:shikimate kinase
MRVHHTFFTLSISCIICFLYIQKAISYYSTPSITHSGKSWSHSSVGKSAKQNYETSISYRNRFFPSLELQSSKAIDLFGEENIILIPSENPIEDLTAKLKGTCVFFVGPMGSGKSTLGEAFAKKMGYRFLDTDEIAEFMIEMPITDFFAEGREAEFRQLEYDILMDLSQYTRVVVATGGGIVMKNENWGMLRHGIVVYIDLPVEDIHRRLISDPIQIAKRPLLQGVNPLETLQKLNAIRRDKYMQADVHLVVPAAQMTPDELAVFTAQTILDFIATNPPRWEGWKKKRDDIAIEAAARMNPSATALAGVGFGDNRGDATIKRVSMQDIQSGKVKLPGSEGASDILDEDGLPMPLQ